MTAVLVFGNYRASVAVVRSLGRAGCRVIVGVGGERSFAERSRFCAETWWHPSIRKGEEAFLAALRAFLAVRTDISLLVPVDQASVSLMARRSDWLPDHVRLVMPAPRLVIESLDKPRMLGHAIAAGVPTEPFVIVPDLVSLAASARDIGYPVIVRPTGSSAVLLPGAVKAVICESQAALEDAFAGWPAAHRELLVQRFSPGPRHNVYFAANNGRLLDRVEVLVLRTDRPDDAGYAVEGISIAPSATLDRYAQALVGALDYTGVGCLQFLRLPDGGFHFLELNARLGANYAIAKRCGLDLARVAWDLATGRVDRACPGQAGYPTGIRYAWTFGDLQGLSRAYKCGELSPVESLRWLVRLLSAMLRADVHLTWSIRDPMPTLCLYAYWAPFGIGRTLVDCAPDGDHRAADASTAHPPGWPPRE